MREYNKTINFKQTTYDRIIRYLRYKETPDIFINKVLDHWDKTTARDSKGKFKGGNK
jgi:hypothetical protein